MKIEISGLKENEDAYGNNISDTYHKLGGGYDIIEREDGHFTLNGDSDAYTEEFSLWSSIQKEASKLVEGKTLDIGCGGGKHAIHFQEQGIEVWGMDNSPLGIDICRKRGLKNSILCDVNDLTHDVIAGVSTVYMWGNNAGLLQNQELARRFLSNCEKICKPNAKILLETLNPFGKAFNYPDDQKYIQENINNGRMGGQIRVRVRYRHFATPWRDYLFFSKEELNTILSATNWKVEHYYDDEEIDQYIAVLVRK